VSYSIGVEQGAVYTIVGPDGTRAVINDPTDADFVGFLTSPPTGLERAAVRENGEDLPEADGGVHGDFLYGRLSWTLQGVIPPLGSKRSWIDRQNRLLVATDAMRGDAELRWSPSEGVPVRVRFRQQQPTRITERRPKQFIVAGVCEGSGVEAQGLSVVTVTPGGVSPAGFLRFPLAFPLGAGGSVVSTALRADALGRSVAWPTITVYGPCVNPTITNAATGQTIALTYTLNANESLVVDTAPRSRTVLLNGQANRYSAVDFLNTSWWGLVPGQNDLRLGLDSFGDGCRMDVEWRDVWG
jgi:hypothetical protein